MAENILLMGQGLAIQFQQKPVEFRFHFQMPGNALGCFFIDKGVAMGIQNEVAQHTPEVGLGAIIGIQLQISDCPAEKFPAGGLMELLADLGEAIVPKRIIIEEKVRAMQAKIIQMSVLADDGSDGRVKFGEGPKTKTVMGVAGGHRESSGSLG